MPSVTAYCEFEVSLEGIKPRIWRRFRLRKNSTFHELHDTIQRACGWQDCHLYAFHPVGSRELLAVSPYYAEEGEVVPVATAIGIDTFFDYECTPCIYQYDFGDDWEHLVELKGIERLPSQGRRKLIGGERAFPPEDCGGVHGYYQCLEAFRISDAELERLDDETKEELLSVRSWFGDWDPERFDFEATARELRRRVR
ncbi:MAG: plasmid pRiA4b ORF-3 family protein [Phycisphaerae bacterium]